MNTLKTTQHAWSMPMESKRGPTQRTVRESSRELLLLASDSVRASEVLSPLEARNYRVRRVGEPREAVAILRERWPALVIVAAGDQAKTTELRASARERDIPVLDVIEDLNDPNTQAERLAQADNWLTRASVAAELPARVESLLRRWAPVENSSAATPPPADGRFLGLVIHDMRTPLNVIGLSMRMIEQAVPKGDPDLDEDLRFVDENLKQIEQMLAQMSDYFRLYEGDVELSVSEFSPRRLAAELVETRALKVRPKAPTVRLEVRDSCPAEVSLDQIRAKNALQYALNNAIAATKGGEVVLTLSGGSDRWNVEIRTDQPPPASVQSIELRPTAFERLCGSAAERRGMDLSIVARVTQLFGGTARLDVLPGGGTAIVLDWPVRAPQH